ncbi:MAG TPA: flagellar hook-basal body complex protein FliE [Caulobacteraceae bacterium]|jgi:flagellar hook-basal body complex protein FliE|nr:flagellar hook-basal body complex protein FliE [Caulobacteraceae bacterium]
MVTPLIAAKAYAATQGAAVSAPGAAQPAAGPDFAKMLGAVMNDAVGASRHAESQMAAQVQGKAQLVDVVTAISSAEASLETVMAVRDQVISAYQEIMRMPI